MATLSKYRSGWRIQWTEGRDRKTIYPGQMNKKQAGTVRTHLEALVTAKKARTAIPDATASWVAGIDLALREKLHNAGLIEQPEELAAEDVVTLGEHVDRFISLTTAKVSTKTVWKRCRRTLLTYFGGGRPVDSITVGDAKEFRAWMLTEGHTTKDGHSSGLAENTVRKMCAVAAQFFRDAVDRETITRNPFTNRDIPRTVRENRTRDSFISRETIAKVMDACPDAEWRLIVALSRYGGLRCPSEHLAMKWADVDWERGRFTVFSSKTEHHEGKGSRVVPIFPELRPYLEDAWNPEAVHVISRYRDRNVNLRTQLERFIAFAGVEAWPKLFHNLRASRETELVSEYPIQTVCSWLGNSPVVAAKHYLQVREEDFTRASAVKCAADSDGQVASEGDNRSAGKAVSPAN